MSSLSTAKARMKDRYAHLDTAHPKDGWVILGPGGGGCVHTLTISPHRPDTLLVSCDMTAGYITQDGGKSWREFNLKSRQFAYAFDPLDPDTIYVGTSGLFRSTDNGATWRLIFPDPEAVTGETRLGDECYHAFISSDNWPGKSIHAILIDPLYTDHLYIVIKKAGPLLPVDVFYQTRKEGLYIYASSDRGKSWRQQAEFDSEDVNLLAFDPSIVGHPPALLLFTEKEIYRIPPDGRPEKLPLPGGIDALRHASCGTHPETGKTIFYIIGDGNRRQGRGECLVWKTEDFGLTWQEGRPDLGRHIAGQKPIFSQVSACAVDARRVYIICESYLEQDPQGEAVVCHGILRSDDAGETWAWVVKMSDNHDPANRVGGWAERDYGAKWGDITGDHQISPKGRFAWDVVASPVDPDVCYTMDFSTIFVTRDGGVAWEQLVTHLHPDGSISSRGIDVLGPYGVFFDPFDPEHIAISVTDAGIFHSKNSGRTWFHELDGVPREWINTCYWMVFDPQVPGRAWSAWSAMHDIPRIKMMRDEYFARDKGGVCKTDDGLKTWRPCVHGLPEHALCTHLLLESASPVGSRTLYAAVFRCGVYKSTDDGLTWEQRNTGLDPRNLFAWRLARHPGGDLYLVTVKNRMRGHELTGAIYRSTDGAANWVPIAMPEGVDFPNDLVIDSTGRLYLACWPRLSGDRNLGGGVYSSDDGGQTWRLIFDRTMHVYTVEIDSLDESILYTSTFDAALFRSHDRGRTWKRLKGYNFQWGYRPVLDIHHPGMLYVTTFGSSVWYGPAEGMDAAIEDITN